MTRDVVIIGGGLTGLAAANELERLAVAYTLIEVKPQFGGGAASIRQGGFIFDSGPMCHPIAALSQFAVYLDQIGLGNEQHLCHPCGAESDSIALAGGTAALVEALAARITAPTMKRMAVSTLGHLEDNQDFSICMENGLVLNARALIVAAPARFAERMLYTLVPEAAYRLLDYPYDSIVRVSLGYVGKNRDRVADRLPPADQIPGAQIVSVQSLAHPSRTPENGVIVQAALNIDLVERLNGNDTAWVSPVIRSLRLPDTPLAAHIGFWPESDPALWRDSHFVERMAEINRLLPAGVALAGSDYIPARRPPCLDERLRQGVLAAQKVAQYL